MQELTDGLSQLYVRENRTNRLADQRRHLPIYPLKEQLMTMIQKKNVVVVVGETGSGKTTQIPQYLMEAGYDRMAVTQPRRIAAVTVAQRVSDEVGCQLGSEVGYTIRFEDISSERTAIRYMTDGILLGELMRDNDLSKYSCVMLDEAHERSINTDILFGVFADLLLRRTDLKLIVASATLDATKFANYFSAPVFEIPGRTHPVDVVYDTVFLTAANMANYVPYVVAKVGQVHAVEPSGDILVFLTGQEDVEYCCYELEQSGLPLKVLPLYGSLPGELQQEVLKRAPTGYRKVVVATNIAETSITLDGIANVIDLGYVKQTSYDQKTRMNTLKEERISQASAEQRKGRAGRTRRGKCFRLYSEDIFE
ncbi:ATP-dependent RNA helicase DHX8 isoform 2 [Aphelenchoides avenae]|nr:ATP-dependent RNA helicase DHX8 isoform 2 [Aphelenchus avenae]